MRKAILLAFMLCAIPLLAEDRPVVLAVSRVYGYGNLEPTLLHNQIVSELIARYNCTVLTRSKLYNVAIEDAIKTLASLDERVLLGVDEIPAADFAISVRVSCVKKGEWDGVVRCFDVNNSYELHQNVRKVEFSATSMFNIPEKASKAIAECLSLPEKRVLRDVGAQEIKALVWSVPSFNSYYKQYRAKTSMMYKWVGKSEEALTEEAELTVQNAGRIERLVDHRQIDAILAEKRLSSLSGLGLSDVVRTVGADCMLVGSMVKQDGNYRVDLHLVDARTGNIFDAETSTCDTEAMLKDLVATGTTRLLERGARPAVLERSSKQQRMREAEYYLNVHDLYFAYGASFVTFKDDDRALAALENAEAAYLLARDDPLVVYRSAEIMSDLLELHNYRCRRGYAETITHRAAYVSNMILKPITNSDLESYRRSRDRSSRFGKGFIPLLFRAEALLFIGKYNEAIRVAEEHSASHPEIQPEKVLWILAKSNIGLGQVEKARVLGRQIAVNYEESADYRELQHALAATGSEDRAFFEAVRKKLLAGEDVERVEESDRYLDLLVRLEEPKKALKELQWMDVEMWSSGEFPFRGRHMIWVAQARCYLLLGDKLSAARRCKDVIFLTNVFEPKRYAESRHKSYHESYHLAANMLKEVEDDIGVVDELWRTAADVKPVPSKYKIYYVVIDDFPEAHLIQQARETAQFFGAEVRILRNLSMRDTVRKLSKSDDFYFKKDEYYNMVVSKLIVPDDALMVFLVGKEGRVSGRPLSYNKGNPLLFLVKRADDMVAADMHWADISRAQILGLCHSIRPKDFGHDFPFDIEECTQRPCIMIWNLAGSYLQDIRRALCPSCQDLYRQIDYDAIRKDLMSYLRKKGASIVKPAAVDCTVVMIPNEMWEITDADMPISGDFLYTDSGERGLNGVYYSGMNFETQVLTRVDKNVDFNWGNESAEGLCVDKFSVRWTGKIKPLISGTYRFATESDDGVRFWINGEMRFDNWTAHGPTFDSSGEINLEAGKAYDLKLEYYENTGGASIKLYWKRKATEEKK